MVKSIHKPALLKESIDLLNVTSGTYVDCTLGGGGHALEIGRRLKAEGGKVIGFDVDGEAIERFEQLLRDKGWKEQGKLFKKAKVEIGLVRENFAELKKGLKGFGISKVQGIVADLGVSSDQLDDASRGFSYMEDGPLDMRMDRNLKVTASDLVNGLYEKELTRLFKESDERYAKRIAKAIVNARRVGPIKTTLHLKQIIQKALPFEQEGRGFRHTSKKGGRIKDNRLKVCQSLRRTNPPKYRGAGQRRGSAYWKKPAMRVFQALRIAVNSELSSLQHLLPQALDALAAGPFDNLRLRSGRKLRVSSSTSLSEKGGRFVIISFHSGEDRIVKKFFKEQERLGKIEILTKKPIRPSSREIEENLRARSAKLRAYEKLK